MLSVRGKHSHTPAEKNSKKKHTLHDTINLVFFHSFFALLFSSCYCDGNKLPLNDLM